MNFTEKELQEFDEEFDKYNLGDVKSIIKIWIREHDKRLIEHIKEKVMQNQKGQFQDDAGNICWYLDDLETYLNSNI